MTNQARRIQARQAINAYQICTGQQNVSLLKSVTGLLTDILHLIYYNGYEIDRLLETAKKRFQAEVDKDEPI